MIEGVVTPGEEGYDIDEKIYAEILTERNAVTAKYKQYFKDQSWQDSKYTMANIKPFEVTKIEYTPAVVLSKTSITSIYFRSPKSDGIIKPIKFLIVDFPADIWGSMLKKDKDLGMSVQFILLDEDLDDPSKVKTYTELFYFRSNKLVIPFAADTEMLSERNHVLELTGLPMPGKQVKQLKKNLILMGATELKNWDNDNSREVPQYVALSHPDLYDFPVTKILVPRGKFMISITQDGGEASLLLIKKGVYSTKACFEAENPIKTAFSATLDNKSFFEIKGEF